VYPISEQDITCASVKIPSHWKRAYGMDFGWHATAVVWGAQDPSTKQIFIYAAYKRGKQPPYVHINAIKAKGEWIPGISDPSKGATNQHDGTSLMDEYIGQGLNLTPGKNALVAGIGKVYNMLESGQLKFVCTLTELLDEFRTYRYDIHDPNNVARNQDDHLLDSLRYLIMSFEEIAISYDEIEQENEQKSGSKQDSYVIGRSSICGY
jgi:hypothetical protein